MLQISNPVQDTVIVGIFLIAALLFSARKISRKRFLDVDSSLDLKGFAILGVIFAHIGYLLASDTQFLFPLSIFGGVAVNMFLFLSGFGRVIQASSREETVLSYYKKELPRLLIPFWLSLLLFLILDAAILYRFYSLSYVFQSFLGIFTSADAWSDINSPYWYFTLILFYYLLFPLLWLQKYPWISAIALYVATVLILTPFRESYFSNVFSLYEVHLYAFPLGVLLGYFSLKPRVRNVLERYSLYSSKIVRVIAIVGLLACIGYFSVHSNVDKAAFAEESISLLLVFAIILLIEIIPFRVYFLSLIGFYSYELYLLHWPLLSRFGLSFSFLPPWLSVIASLGLLLGIATLFKKITIEILRRTQRIKS